MEYVIIAILLVILFATVGLDITVYIIKKLKVRFYQGRVLNVDKWAKNVYEISRKWIIKTPKVEPTDDSQYQIIKLFKSLKKVESIQVWQKASLYLGLLEYKDYLSKPEQEKVGQLLDGATIKQTEICDSDYGLLAYAYMCDNKRSNLIKGVLDYIDRNLLEDGVVAYKQNVKTVSFVDTLGFVCPLLVKYGLENKEEERINQAIKQIEIYLQYGIEKNTKLPFHGYDIKNKALMGICDWARGAAWLLIAIMESYQCFLSNNRENLFLRNKIEEYANLLIVLQEKNGGFAWQLTQKHKPKDSSATAVFGWFLAKAGGIFNEEKFFIAAKKCREFLMAITYTNGVIDYSQGDTISIGEYSRNFGILPFSQGYALRLHVAILENESRF